MSEQQGPDRGNENKTPAGIPASAGQRLDQFLSNAQRLGDVARQKAREVADAAAPRLKEMGHSASATTSRILDERARPGSPLDRVRQYIGAGGDQRKVLLRGGIIVGGLLLFSLLMLPIGLYLQSGPGPTEANFGNAQSGMTEGEVDGVLGMATSSVKTADGSTAKTWVPQDTHTPAMLVTFVDGKAATKMLERPSGERTGPATDNPVPASGDGLVVATNGSDYAAMDVPTLASAIEQKLMPGQGLMPEAMWQKSVYPSLCSNQYTLGAIALKNLQMANRVSGECQKAILALQQKLPDPTGAKGSH